MASEAKTLRSRRTRAALVAATRARLAEEGRFTAEAIAADTGCTPGTFWAHFGTKDEAVLAAMVATLDDLVGLVAELFGEVPPLRSRQRRTSWAANTVEQLIDYFVANALLIRVALGRSEEHRPVIHAYRNAEERIIDLVLGGLTEGKTRDDAAAVVIFCQGINNAIVMRSKTGGTIRKNLATALSVLAG